MPPTLAAVLDRAADVCDPTGQNDAVADLVARFEDRDEPITAVADVEQEIAEARGAVDPQEEDPQVVMTAAVGVYLAHRRTEISDDRQALLRLAARAEFDGHPPEPVLDWLSDRDVRV
jgi:hypothetical protein